MTRRSPLPQSRRHIFIYEEDWEFLDLYFGRSGIKPIGTSAAIRTILHAFVQRQRAGRVMVEDQGEISAVVAATEGETV